FVFLFLFLFFPFSYATQPTQQKLKNGKYEVLAQFERDVHLVFANALLFNEPDSDIGYWYLILFLNNQHLFSFIIHYLLFICICICIYFFGFFFGKKKKQ